MKILQIIHRKQNRGAETFACQLSNHLNAQGIEIKMVALYEGKAELPYKGEIVCLEASTGHLRFLDYKAWQKLAVIIRTFKPDVVQVNAGDTLKYAVFSKILFKWTIPIISRNASEVGRYLKSPMQNHLNSFLYKNVDHVISVSEASKKDIVNHFPFLNGKVEVIPVGLEKRDLIEKINFKMDEKKHLIHVGGFSFEKNHQGLFRIFEKVQETRSDVHLHLIGDGPLREEIQRQLKNREVKKKITFYGFIDDPLPFIKASDVLVLPSIIEGLPGVLLEAMYCKTPVVAYDVGGVSEIVNENTGILVEKNCEEEFVHAILETLSQSVNLRIGKAFKLVSNHFMNEVLTLMFVNSYRKVVAKYQ